ncbi:hypothetical protein [Paenibacillus pini]|uniref:Uncharacterized protein n=1 Tax=Paenibacillus pini JCM 16418 TaxID=1236976 RepID=W7YUI6_9BACL|nr:hypothetical protein [Paenibacillus pini]GAF10883.1 hypothetical protein JCM16418_5114 [Paenibacillus pini JCM 16418]
MLDDKEIELYSQHLSGKKFNRIEKNEDGITIVFEGDFVMKFSTQGYDMFDAELFHRVPSYRYDPVK